MDHLDPLLTQQVVMLLGWDETARLARAVLIKSAARALADNW
jgi:hypothetical protein